MFTSQLLTPSSYTTASAALPDHQPVTGTTSCVPVYAHAATCLGGPSICAFQSVPQSLSLCVCMFANALGLAVLIGASTTVVSRVVIKEKIFSFLLPK